MMRKSKITRGLAGALALVFLAACTTPPRRDDASSDSSSGDSPCSVGTSALIGAGIGAVIGGVAGGRDGLAKGALIGGALGASACYVVNLNSRQTRTANESERDYQRARGRLPQEPTVVSYTPKLSSTVVKRGNPMTISSVVEVVNGANSPVQEIREDLQIFNPDGTPLNRDPKAKTFVATSGGRYENSFELTLPPKTSQGVYLVKTNLYVNGKIKESRELKTQLVWNKDSQFLVASR